MRYVYGTNDSHLNSKGRTIPVKQLASLIKRDVDFGKWNLYEGGEPNSVTAHCKYKRKGFIHHELLLIYGNEKEFKKLEQIIKDFIEVKPRKFKGDE